MSYMGRIPVPGCVTSTRDKNQYKQQQNRLKKKAEEDAAREAQLKQSQEEVARFLRFKHKQRELGLDEKEDDGKPPPPPDDDRRRERREDDDRRRDKRSPDRRRDDRNRDSRSPRRGRRYSRSRSRRHSRSRSLRRERRDDDRDRRRDDRDYKASSSAAGSRAHLLGAGFPREAPPSPPQEPGGWSVAADRSGLSSASSSQAQFFNTVQDKEAQQKAEEDKKRAEEKKQAREKDEAKRKSRLKNAFALEDQDDEEEQSRDLALAQAARRAATDRRVSVRETTTGPGPVALHSGAPNKHTEMDMFTALRKIAEFKRSCNGAGRPMPKELQEMAMKISGRISR